MGKLECDFFARRGDSYAYVQVSMTIASPKVERREHASFGRIRDGWPRFLLTLDSLRGQRDEVRHLKPHGVPQGGLEPLLMSPQSPRMYSYAIEGKPQYRTSSRHLEDESSDSNKLYGKGGPQEIFEPGAGVCCLRVPDKAADYHKYLLAPVSFRVIAEPLLP